MPILPFNFLINNCFNSLTEFRPEKIKRTSHADNMWNKIFYYNK